MASLLHEVWEEPDENWRMLEALCLAGPDRDAFRATLAESARLVGTFKAASHIEAMTKYYSMYFRGEYVASLPTDYDPYPNGTEFVGGKPVSEATTFLMLTSNLHDILAGFTQMPNRNII